jgi:hypothetical protein
MGGVIVQGITMGRLAIEAGMIGGVIVEGKTMGGAIMKGLAMEGRPTPKAFLFAIHGGRASCNIY